MTSTASNPEQSQTGSFCDQQAEIRFENKFCSKAFESKRQYVITCKNSSCTMYRDEDSPETPIQLWNTRHKRLSVKVKIGGGRLRIETPVSILTCPFCGNAPVCHENDRETAYTVTSFYIACITTSCIRPRVYGTNWEKIYDTWRGVTREKS